MTINLTSYLVATIFDNYHISDIDDASTVKYYGFVDADGNWYIMKEDTSVSPKTYRYVSGNVDYTTNFTDRASLSYNYFYGIF